MQSMSYKEFLLSLSINESILTKWHCALKCKLREWLTEWKIGLGLDDKIQLYFEESFMKTLRCVIPVACVTNEREENVVEQHN